MILLPQFLQSKLDYTTNWSFFTRGEINIICYDETYNGGGKVSKKIVIDALSSPSLLGQLNEHQKQQIITTAKRGLVAGLSVFLLILHYFVLLVPEQTTNSTNLSSDTLHGGFNSKQELLVAFDNNRLLFHTAAQSLDISKNEIQAAKEMSLDQWLATQPSSVISWSRSPVHQLSGELLDSQYSSSGFLATTENSRFLYYGRSVTTENIAHTDTPVLSGYSNKIGSFAILKSSGNFITTRHDTDVCYKTPDNGLFYSHCPASNSFSVKTNVTNIDYKTDAFFLKNKPNDRLKYTFEASNTSDSTISFKPEIYIGDILEYADLINTDRAQLDKERSTLLWDTVVMQPGENLVLTFDVKLFEQTPVIAQGLTNSSSYDCYISSFFGSQKHIKVSCPTPKVVERMLDSPQPKSLLLFVWLVAITNVVLFVRSYITSKEYEILLSQRNRRYHD